MEEFDVAMKTYLDLKEAARLALFRVNDFHTDIALFPTPQRIERLKKALRNYEWLVDQMHKAYAAAAGRE